jgi:hypothetical protein
MSTPFRLVSVGLLASLCGVAIAHEAEQWWERIPSTRTRAEVRAELEAAQRAGTSTPRYEPLYALQPKGDPTLSRAQVQAEAREAVRLGLTTKYEVSPRQATAAELAQIGQAGLRAVEGSTQHAGK